MEEIWKDIPNYENNYEASNMGRIRTKEGRTTFTKKHGVRYWKSRILKERNGGVKSRGHVTLWLNGNKKYWLVSRLIAITFLGMPQEKLTVNHKNGNKYDNRVDNLEWLTLAENIRHGFEIGLYAQKKVILISGNDSHGFFRSLSQASKFLNRNSGYLSCAINRGLNITSTNGENYRAKLIK